MDLTQQPDNELRFRSLFENNPDLVIFQDEQGIVLDANPAFLAALGKSKEEVLGHPLTDFVPAAVHDLFNRKLAEAFQGQTVNFEVEVKFVGATRPVILNVTKVSLVRLGAVTGVHMVARDVTAAVAAHQVIQDQAQRLNTIFESITDAFFLLDRDFRFSYVNAEVERLLEIARGEVLHQPLRQVLGPGEGEAFADRLEQAITDGQPAHFETFYEKNSRWLDVKAFPSDDQLSVYFSDITDTVKTREELYRQNQDLQQFTYIVSHNLRAPLANALGLVDLLGSVSRHSPDFSAILSNLRASVQQLDLVLRDMNGILTIRDRQGVAEPELVPLADVARQVGESLRETLQERNGKLHLDIPAHLSVRGTRAYLYSVFFNLLSNAVKYRAEDRPLEVHVRAAALPAGGVQLVVEDNGSGFDQERAGTDIFRLYKRFHTTLPGRGVGLYLVKTHIEAMGGTIEVHSTRGVGTRFIITLP